MEAVHLQVVNAFPNLSAEILQNVMRKLLDLCVELCGDLCLLTEQDLCDVMKPIQARKLMTYFKSKSTVDQTETDESQPATPSRAHGGLEQIKQGYPFLNSNWVESFDIPWDSMPKTLLEALHKSKRPTPRDRRKMVRVIIDSVKKVCPKPLWKHLAVVARKVVELQPSSFKDVFDNTVIGTGYDPLLNQLVCRVENVNREDVHEAKVRDMQCAKKKVKLHTIPRTRNVDKGRCGNAKGAGNTTMFKADSSYTEDVHVLMASTHRLQQLDIKLGTSITELKKAWPFLFMPCGLESHVELLGVNITETLDHSLRNKKRVILDFFDKEKHGKPNILRAWREPPGSTQAEAEFLRIVLLTMAWFEEERDGLIQSKEAHSSSEEIERYQDTPVSPCIIAAGDDIWMPEEYLLLVDGHVVAAAKTFKQAFCMLFAAYFCFHTCYAEKASCTLEFIQRPWKEGQKRKCDGQQESSCLGAAHY
ncbi:uncharacterized protein [Dermacentor andersoni]|uniref:uncharacterized protein n=1 Tax=Dermacentor andersoni TaxID=34620 RepID=UPI003B3A7D18